MQTRTTHSLIELNFYNQITQSYNVETSPDVKIRFYRIEEQMIYFE